MALRLSRSFGAMAALPLVVCLLLLNGLFFHRSLERMIDSGTEVGRTVRIEKALSDIQSALVDAETGQRGYLITSDDAYLDPYRNAAPRVRQYISDLRAQEGLTSDLSALADRIDTLSGEKLAEMAKVVAAHSKGGLAASGPLVAEGTGRALMDQIRTQISERRTSLANQIVIQRGVYADNKRILQIIAMVFLGTAIVLVIVIYLLMRRELATRGRAAAESVRYARTLDQNIKLLERERNEIAHLNDSGNFLQSCNSIQEIGTMAGPLMQVLFRNHSGSIWIYAASRNLLTRLASWGDPDPMEHFTPDECWALRRGQAHVHTIGGATPECIHSARATAAATICLPLVAHGETVGLINMARGSAGASGDSISAADDAATMRLAEMAAGQFGLTLGNLQLRDTLNQQSIRDPLTGAFNRRYLDAVAEKEFAIAKRLQRTFAVAMMDVDYFKRFNDLHGHAAGDAALVAITGYLRQHMREGDWLFRYGGEEFLLLFRETGLADAQSIAWKLSEGIAALSIKLGPDPLPSVTVSMGIAACPDHGLTLDELVDRADRALYESKRAGRNTVTSAELLAA